MFIVFEGVVDVLPAIKVGDWDDRTRAPKFSRIYFSATGRCYFGSASWDAAFDPSLLDAQTDWMSVSAIQLSHIINGPEENAADQLWRTIRSLRPGTHIRATFDLRWAQVGGYFGFRVGFLRELQVLSSPPSSSASSVPRSLADVGGDDDEDEDSEGGARYIEFGSALR